MPYANNSLISAFVVLCLDNAYKFQDSNLSRPGWVLPGHRFSRDMVQIDHVRDRSFIIF